jgi:ATPase family associated with various cellular activities (AAA)
MLLRMRPAQQWISSALTAAGRAAAPPAGDDGELSPELADVARLARRLVRQVVSAARAEEGSVRHLLTTHLGPQVATFRVASGTWPYYDHVNVQAALDAWLAGPGREHQVTGITRFHPTGAGLADLAAPGPAQRHARPSSVTTVALPCGPGGATRPCVQCALYLVTDAGGPLVILVRGPEDGSPEPVTLEVACPDYDRGQQVVAEIRRLAVEHNVFRGHVVAFGGDVFGRHGAPLTFLDRPEVAREQVILPPDLLDGIERQVVGVARHAGQLLASGQHLKRGVLLHGAPGTGKTHTVRYLLSELSGVTVVVLSGAALRLISEACSVARTLQPSVIVVEDVDLIAEEREFRMGQHPLLFQLLNEMDGLAPDADVTFLLTTNRADLLEPALAERPGRVDHAALLPLPDAEARRRLLRLYQGNLEMDLPDPDVVITRTEGVTASFLKELLRRAALRAAEPGGAAPLRVTGEHMTAALDELLDTRNQLTQVLLGAPVHGRGQGRGGRLSYAAMGADVVIPERRTPPPGWPLRR